METQSLVSKKDIEQMIDELKIVESLELKPLNWIVNNEVGRNTLIRSLQQLLNVKTKDYNESDIVLLTETQNALKSAVYQRLNMTESMQDLLLNGYIHEIESKQLKSMIPKGIIKECMKYYPMQIQIEVGSFGFDQVHSPRKDSYIRIPEIYDEQNLYLIGSISGTRRGHGIVVLENKFGTLLQNDSFDTWNSQREGERFLQFVSGIPKDSIIIIAIYDSANSYSDFVHEYLRKVGVTEYVKFREPMIFVGSSNGIRKWTYFKIFDRNPGGSEQKFVIPLQS